MEIKIKLLTPPMPNQINFESPARSRNEGISFNNCIEVADMSEEQATEYAALLQETFMNHWRMKTTPNTQPLGQPHGAYTHK